MSAPPAGFRLSPQQRRLWSLQAPGAPWEATCDLDLDGDLDHRRLRAALQRAVGRHDILRTTFRRAPGLRHPVQAIAATGAVSWCEADLSDQPCRERQAALSGLLAGEAGRRLEVAAGPVLRALLVRLGDGEHRLRLGLPALCADSRSLDNLVAELARGYGGEGDPAGGEEIVQYLQFSEWQNDQLGGDGAEAGKRFWRERQLPPAATLDLAGFGGRAGSGERPEPEDVRPAAVEVTLPPAAPAGTVSAADFLLACWQALLWRLGGQAPPLLGLVVHGRSYPELAPALGPFARAVPLSCRLHAELAFAELLEQTAAARADAELWQEHYGADGTAFHFGFCAEPRPQERMAAGVRFALAARRAPVDRFALELACGLGVPAPAAALLYDPRRFAAAAMARLGERLAAVAAAAARDPGQAVADLEVMGAGERRQVLVGFNDTRRDWAEMAPVGLLLERVAAARPDASALVCEDRWLSFAELDALARQLAVRLRRRGVGPEVRVGICAPRSLAAVVAILATWKAGGAFVPLDPAYPPERLAFMMRDAGIAVLLAAAGLETRLPGSEVPRLVLERRPGVRPSAAAATSLPAAADLDQLAYVLYTSGSTGRPKGTAVSHRALANYLLWAIGHYPVAAGRGAPVHSPLGFDLTLTALLAPLLAGRTVELLPEHAGPGALSGALGSAAAWSLVKLTPSHLEILNQALARNDLAGQTHALIIGGEALRGGALEPWRSAAPQTRLFNEYGPTETVVGCCVYEVPPGPAAAAAVPIGHPIANARIYLLDERLRPVPRGLAGQLYVGGMGLARGYLGLPDLTAAVFIPDPFAGEPGARLYRTGDLARLAEDGILEFHGRVDEQVKLRGFRIEPGEIEAVLAEHPQVQAAAVAVREAVPGNRFLAAYVVGRGEAAPSALALEQFLRARLPDFMVPAAFVRLPALPLSANGKVDRRALPATLADAEPPPWRPQSLTEDLLAEIWTRVLGRAPAGRDADFIAHGGHSLLAMQVLARVRRVFGLEIAIDRFFARPTLAALAAQIDSGLLGGEAPELPAIGPRARDGELPLSAAQERLWVLSQLSPGGAAYHIPAALLLRGELSIPALAHGLSEVVRRHEVLRTTFGDVDGRAVQRVAPCAPRALPVVDLAALPPPCRRTELDRLALVHARRPFQLSSEPPLRFLLVRLAAAEHAALCCLHHIAADGWSVHVLVRELSELYAAALDGRRPRLAELKVQYADFALWQRRWAGSDRLAAQLAYWRHRLAGRAAALELPADRPRPAVRTDAGALWRFTLPAGLRGALRASGRDAGATLFMVLLAGFQALLTRLTGQPVIDLGTVVAGRGRLEIEDLIGLFVNTLVLRLEPPPGASFAELLAHVRQVTIAAQAHQELPFERLVEALKPERDLGRTPLFQVMAALDVPAAQAELSGLQVEALPLHTRAAKFDLSLLMRDDGDLLGGLFEYSIELFDAATVARLAGGLLNLLQAAAADPSQRTAELPLLSAAERHQTLVEHNDSQCRWPSTPPVHRLFEAQAARTPEAPALTTDLAGGVALSFAELDRLAGKIAAHLVALGVGPEVRVGLALQRSPQLVAAILGVLKAGGAYVPLDPGLPPERLALMLGDSAAALVLVEGETARHGLGSAREVRIATLIAGREPGEGAPPPLAGEPDSLAYVMYTSGSTGRPKGTMICHRGLTNYLLWALAAYAPEAGGGACLHTSVGFDLAVTSLFLPLLAGRPVRLAAPGEGIEPVLATFDDEQTSSFVKLTPSHLRALAGLAAAGRLARSTRMLIVGGEALSAEDLEAYRRHGRALRVVNEYGPTETVVGCCVYEARPGDFLSGPVPIGRPIANLRLYGVDAQLQPLPVGAVGELLIGGPALARGYLGRPEITAAAFIPDPFGPCAGERLYRTGDLVRRRADGNLEFRGRRDQQVKVRGFRVEPAEIEAALAAHAGVDQAVVVARRPLDGGEARLVAYVVATSSGLPRPGQLQAFLRERLPAAMVPAVFVELAALPLAASGKVDLAALPPPAEERPRLDTGFAAPRNRVERLLAVIWQEVLRLDRVGIHDNFFEIGGDSILSIQIVARARQQGLWIAPRQIFERQTIAVLAAVAGSGPDVQVPQEPVAGEVPLTPIEHWFLAQDLADPHHYNQALLLVPGEPLDAGRFAAAAATLPIHHDALRLRFERLPTGWRQVHAAPDGRSPLVRIDLSALQAEPRERALAAAAAALQGGFDLGRGRLLRIAWFDHGGGEPPLLLMLGHHLVVDAVSWRILLDDLEQGYRQLCRGEPLALAPKTTAFKSWAERLVGLAGSTALDQEAELWRASAAAGAARLPRDHDLGPDSVGSAASVAAALERDETRALLQELPRAASARSDEIMLAALAVALAGWTGSNRVQIDVEGHGREEVFRDVDLSRTVGWFTTLHPVALDVGSAADSPAQLAAVKEQLRRIPNAGLGYGVLRYLRGGGGRQLAGRRSEVVWNYLGQLDATLGPGALLRPAGSPGAERSARQQRPYLLEITASVLDGRLRTSWVYSENRHRRATLERLAQSFLAALREIIAGGLAGAAPSARPEDFARVALTPQALDKIASELELD
jgi:amino acid adenylation domain-containing protein/non-ribosomal peptide synthase protein (TIGR01720 family)